MKTSKLLFLGMLASSLCMVGSALGQDTVGFTDTMSPDGVTFNVGDNIEYILCVSVPAGEQYYDLVNLDVYFFPPGSAPSEDACDDPVNEGIFIGHIDRLEPGEEVCFANDPDPQVTPLYPDLRVPVSEAGCTGADPIILVAYMATTYYRDGQPTFERCDEELVVDDVNPMDPPVCNLTGPEIVCEGDSAIEYSTTTVADSYLWSVTGDADIDGDPTLTSITVTPTSAAGFTVHLMVCTDNGAPDPADWCCSTCDQVVTVIEAPDCSIDGPDEVCEDAEDVMYESDDAADTYEWTITGDGEIVGTPPHTGSTVLVNPTGEGGYTLSLEICYEDPLCCATCDLEVDIIPTPDCRISGPETICEEDIDTPVQYCTDVVASNKYDWNILSGPATISGADDGMCVEIIPSALGTIVLDLIVCDDVLPTDGDPGECCNSCEIEILVEECGGGYCTFTQGYYGNAGGTQCGGMTTTEIIDAALLSGPVIIGDPDDGPSITLNSAACIIERLPAGGKPSALPSGIGEFVDDCGSSSSAALKKLGLLKKKNKQGERYQNVLIGQVVALTLNMRLHTIPCMDADGFDQGLGDYEFPDADYICVQKGEEGCIERYEIPEILKGMPVSVLLELANEALAGDKALIGGAYAGASFVNELFDECWTIVTCPPEDSCDYCDADTDTCVDY